MAKTIGEKRLLRNIETRKKLWPDLSSKLIWNWKTQKGFGTIPRTLPYFFKIMNDLSIGKPVSSTYFALWARLWDQSGLLKIRNAEELAWESGFTKKRAVDTWRSRMKILEELGFIKSQPLGTELYGYIFIVNPYQVLKELKTNKKYDDQGWMNALMERVDNLQVIESDDDDD